MQGQLSNMKQHVIWFRDWASWLTHSEARTQVKLSD